MSSKISTQLKVIAQILILSFLASGAQARVEKYSNWKLITYSPSEQNYFRDNIPIFDQEGKQLYIDKIEDKPILIVFWASWCTHCSKMIASLDVLKKDFRKIDLEILAVSEDYQGVNIIKKFFEENQIRHLNILYDYKFKLFDELNMSSLPYAFLLDKDKKIVLKFDGSVPWQDEKVRRLLLSYVPNNPVEPKNTYREEFFNATKKVEQTNEQKQEDKNNENR